MAYLVPGGRVQHSGEYFPALSTAHSHQPYGRSQALRRRCTLLLLALIQPRPCPQERRGAHASSRGLEAAAAASCPRPPREQAHMGEYNSLSGPDHSNLTCHDAWRTRILKRGS